MTIIGGLKGPVWLPKASLRLRVIKNILWKLDTLRMEKEEFSESPPLYVRRPIQGPHVVKIIQGRNVPITRTCLRQNFFFLVIFCADIFCFNILIIHHYH